MTTSFYLAGYGSAERGVVKSVLDVYYYDQANTNLYSCGDRGGSEEPHPQAGTRAYYKYVEESDVATTKVYA
jgi:hypothetical protein